jgi:hypothetical protein
LLVLALCVAFFGCGDDDGGNGGGDPIASLPVDATQTLPGLPAEVQVVFDDIGTLPICSAIVDQKTNEIPVARELFRKLDLDGRQVSLDALHTQDQTARELVLDHGADYLFTVKDNQPTLRANIEKSVTAPPADFSPSGRHGHAGR